jgi:lysophospholipase L1-like esterase
MARILVFGDSLTWGAWDIKGGWVERLKCFFIKRYFLNPDFYHLVYNLGVSGNTTEDLLKRFELETKQRLKEELEKEIIFIFAIGVNDSCFLKNKNNFWVLPEKFKENLQRLIKLTKKYSLNIAFLGLMPVDESKTTPVSRNQNIFYKNEYIQKYNEIIKTVCKENNVYFIEIFEKLIKENYKNLLEDGVHPNSKGHQKIFKIVKDFLIKNKIIY